MSDSTQDTLQAPCKNCDKPEAEHLRDSDSDGLFCASNPNDSRRYDPMEICATCGVRVDSPPPIHCTYPMGHAKRAQATKEAAKRFLEGAATTMSEVDEIIKDYVKQSAEIERLRAVLKDHPCGDRRCPAHD